MTFFFLIFRACHFQPFTTFSHGAWGIHTAVGCICPIGLADFPFFFDGSAICCMLYIKYSPKWSSHIYIMLV